MRDALSLLDQAVAFGGGGLRDDDVADMLGSIDRRHIDELLQSLVDADAVALMTQIRMLQELVPDYESVLDDLATVLQQITIVQLAGVDALDEDADVKSLQRFAGVLSDDVVQLYYQIAITRRRDLGLAPDPRIGFEMTLLRMLAFQPVASADGGVPQRLATPNLKNSVHADEAAASPSPAEAAPAALAADADWSQIMQTLKLNGAVRQLAENCVLVTHEGEAFELNVSRSSEYLLTEQQKKALISALQEMHGMAVSVKFTVVDDSVETIATRNADESAQQMQAAQESIHNDPNVKQLVDMFGAKVETDSIRPVHKPGEA